MSASEIDKLMAKRAADATPAYTKTLAEGDRVIWNPTLERVSASADVQDAMHKAVRAWQTNAVADGYGAMNPGAIVESGGMLKMLGGKVPVFPNLQFWDYVKRELDPMIQQAIEAKHNSRARALTKITQELRGSLDTEVPSYKDTRALYGDPSQSIKAIEAGQNLLQMRPEDIAKTFAKFPGNEDLLRLGAARGIKEIAGAPTDKTRQLLSPNMNERLQEIFKDKGDLQKAVSAWTLLKKQGDLGNKVRGGSATYENIAGEGGVPLETLTKAIRGKPISAAMDVLRNLNNRAKGITPDVAESGAWRLFSADPANQSATLRAIDKAREKLLTSQYKRSGLLSGAPFGALGLLGQ